jgi:transposase
MEQLNQCDKTNKKCFQTEGDALRFEIENRRQYGNPQQYPYLCEHCGFHHLSKLPVGETTRARVDYEDAAKYVVRTTRRTADEQLELHNQIVELTNQGKTTQQIAEQLNISTATVYNLRNGKLSGALAKTVEGIEIKKLSIQEQIAKLQTELEAEEKRKQQLIEARQLRVQWSEVPGGDRVLVITQDQNRFALIAEDATKLITLLKEAFAKAA